jgi:hypothetical protein
MHYKKMDIKYYYVDSNNNMRKNGIYCRSIDRFLLFDNYDFAVTLKTAKILSSKINSTVLILPSDLGDMNNKNSLEFTYSRDSKFETSIQIPGVMHSSQLPDMKVITEQMVFENVGLPLEYDSGKPLELLYKLKSYAEYCQKVMYANKFCEILSTSLIPYEVNLYKDIENVLYFGEDVEVVEKEIKNLWEKYYNEFEHLYAFRESFFDMMETQNASV